MSWYNADWTLQQKQIPSFNNLMAHRADFIYLVIVKNHFLLAYSYTEE